MTVLRQVQQRFGSHLEVRVIQEAFDGFVERRVAVSRKQAQRVRPHVW